MTATGPQAAPALQVRNLQKSFGAIHVANDINLSLPRGARHALIGPNGAGKTTLVNLISGALRASAGEVLLDGEKITALSQAGRTRRGIARTFQINRLFRGLTVLENVFLAIGERTGACNRLWRSAGGERAVIDEAARSPPVARARAPMPASRCANCHTAGSGWSRLRSRWRSGRNSCCSTSRRPACPRRKTISSST